MGAEGTTLKMVEVFKVLEIHKWRKEKNCYRNNVRKLGAGGTERRPPPQNVFPPKSITLNLLGF